MEKLGAIRSIKRVNNLMSPTRGVTPGAGTEYTIGDKSRMSYYSDREKQKEFAAEVTQQQQTSESSDGDIGNLISSVSSKNVDMLRTLDNLMSLHPDLKQVGRIMISSVMSPSDMQEGNVGITVDYPNVPAQLLTDIKSRFTDLMNVELQYGRELVQVLWDTFFYKGAHGKVIVPHHNIEALYASTKVEEGSMESLKEDRGGDPLPDNVTPVIAGPQTIDSHKTLFFPDTKISSSMESLGTAIEIANDDGIEFKHDAMSAIADSYDFTPAELEALEPAVEKFASQVTKSKSDAEYIIVHDNPRAISDNTSKTKDNAKKASKRVMDYFSGILGRDTETFVMSNAPDSETSSKPTVLTIPTEAIVPVTVPGSSQRIGYFILVDRWGNPLSFAEQDKGIGNASSDTSKYARNIFDDRTKLELSPAQQNNIAAKVYGLTINNVLKDKLKSVGMDSVTVAQHDTMNACLLRHYLNKRKVGFIFVPDDLMVYYAIDYRKDGTGKAVIEDVHHALILKATMTMARFMASIRNATPQKVVTVDTNKLGLSFEEVDGMVRAIHTAKYTGTFGDNYGSITRQLNNQGLIVQPKSLRGAGDGIEVTTEENSRNYVMPDTDLMEDFYNNIYNGLGTPHSFLNKMGEFEFSRSLATTNLVFSNFIRVIQIILEELNTKFLRLYTAFCPELIEELQKLIDGYKDKEGMPEDLSVADILMYTKVTLPTPHIATTSAHYNEVSEYMRFINEAADILYSDEAVPVDDRELKELMTSLKATVRSDKLKEMLDNIGFTGALDMPSLDNVAVTKLFDRQENMTQILVNNHRGISDLVTVLKADGGSGY